MAHVNDHFLHRSFYYTIVRALLLLVLQVILLSESSMCLAQGTGIIVKPNQKQNQCQPNARSHVQNLFDRSNKTITSAFRSDSNSVPASAATTDATCTSIPEYAAREMSSISFLKELVQFKDTINEHYYTGERDKIFDDDSSDYYENNASTNANANNVQDQHPDRHPHMVQEHIVEYTGRLWFLRKTPVRFQEVVRLKEISPCGTRSSVECITKYKTTRSKSASVGASKANSDSNSNSGWHDCSRVICTFSSTGSNDGNKSGSDAMKDYAMSVSSELLVGLPLFGIRKKVTKHISDTFESAARVFLEDVVQI